MNHIPSLTQSLAEGRDLLSLDVSAIRRKQLGQCFTGMQTGRLLAALAVNREQRRIADPMAGHGDLLEAVAERASRLHATRDELLGVEIEPEAAQLGYWRVQRCMQEYGFRRSSFIHGDAFAESSWDGARHFDLVITNPPYVRYQTLAQRKQADGVKLLNAEATRRALEKLATRFALPEEYALWRHLIRSYSGLADLSLPSWLLSGLLTAPSGVLALVVPQMWLNRDYAKLARYFFLRFFQPLTVVQESGQRWFRDVLVPVSLVVGRRLPTDEVLKPLQERQCAFKTPFVEIDASAATEQSHVGNAFASDDPEREFARWLEAETGSPRGIKLKHISWEAQRDEVLAAARGAAWLQQIEAGYSTGTATSPATTNALPSSITSLLPTTFLNNTRPLASEPIRVGQGLRTGCNAFFYVEVEDNETQKGFVTVVTSELFRGKRLLVPAEVLKPVLRKQVELSGMQVMPAALRGRLLDLRGYLLPEYVQQNKRRANHQFPVLPQELADYVRLAACTYLVRGETRTLIPRLSAVKTNGLSPKDADDSPWLFTEQEPRLWYMVPDFAPRHLPGLLVPRIIHDEPMAILNAEPPVLIDANFSTLWCENDAWSAAGIFALLNSTWCRLCMEALGTTLGGGALKLEATHLRQLPIPVFSNEAKEKMRQLACRMLDSEPKAKSLQPIQSKIDQFVISAFAQRQLPLRETTQIAESFAEHIQKLRDKRRRNYRQSER